MGGRLAVDSRPGQGTTFTITLPAAEAASEPQRKRA
jgi:signal transduction histidine kinase